MLSTVSGVGFAVLATIVVGCAVMMLASRNVVHAAFWMLGSMLGTAGIYTLLSAGFVALVQVMVYAGAVAVLLLFVIMLTLRRREDAVRSRDFSLPAAALAVTFLGLILIAIRGFAPKADSFPDAVPGIVEFGTQLFSRWALPFEVASLVLTVALVGAVWWSNGGGDE